MDQRITRFLRKHHVITLATVSDRGSWTAHCFYACMPDDYALVFTTDSQTRHGHEMLQNPHVSGGIILETKVIGKIRGIQLTGRAFPVTSPAPADSVVHPEEASGARKAYIRRFPFALAVKLDLWILQVDFIKMTDNRFGFGKKIEWKREDVEDVKGVKNKNPM